MTAAVLHLVLPGQQVARALPQVGERIGDFLERVGWAKRGRCADGKLRWQFSLRLPTICVVNGVDLLQRQWRRRRIKAGDAVTFLSRPYGGGGSGSGKQVLGLVALIAVAAFAIWAGPVIAGMAGLEGVAFGSLTYAQLFTAGIVMGGSVLINTLVTPQVGGTGDDQPAQVYSLNASGNTGRPLEPLPVWYGRNKDFPAFATQPWSEYVGDTQFLNVLLTPTCGKMDVEAITNDDTPLWNKTDGVVGGDGSGDAPPPDSGFYTSLQPNDAGVAVDESEMQVWFYNPGELIEAFPADVTTAAEVSGQQLTTSFVGGFIANAAGSKTFKLGIDLLFPSGCFTQDGNKIRSRGVPVVVEARPVNDAGAPLGPYTTLISTTLSYAVRQPKRVSLMANVAADPGRYQVQMRRTNAELTENGTDALNWVGLRAYLVGDNRFADTFTIAIRCKADKVAQGGRRFGVIGTRILPVYDTDPESETYQQWVERPTRNPFWAFYNKATNTRYGAKFPVDKVDFQGIVTEAIAADARGDTFDYIFKTAQPAPQAFDTILGAARARHRWLSDTLSVIRDQKRAIPQLLLTDREIVRGSFSLGFAFETEDAADCVILEYLNEETWAPAQVQYPPNNPPTFIGQKPATFRRDGIVNPAQALRECAFLWRQSQFRRVTGSLDTEWDGRMLAYGSYIRVQSELPQVWGASAVIESRDGLALQLDRDLPWEAGKQHYIEVRNKRGGRFGPVKVSEGDDPSLALLDEDDLEAVEDDQSATLDETLEREDGAEDVSIAFGTAEHRAQDVLVMAGDPDGDRVSLSLVVDDDRVHDESDLGSPPTVPTPPLPRNQPAPLVRGLTAIFRQAIAEPVLDVSWVPAPGAAYYVLEISYDDGEHWGPLATTSDSNYSGVVDYAALSVRVQGVGLRKGAWSQVDVEAPTLKQNLPVDIVNLTDEMKKIISQVAPNVAAVGDQGKSLIQNWIKGKQNRDQLQGEVKFVEQVAGDASASILQQAVAQAAQNLAFAQLITAMQARVGSTESGLVTEALVRSLQDEALSSLINALTTTVGGNSASITSLLSSVNGVKVQFGVTGTINGVTGGFVFTGIQKLDGSVSYALEIQGNVIVDGTITAPKLAALSVTAGKIAAGAINVGTIIVNDLIVTGHLHTGAASNIASGSHGNLDVGTGLTTNVYYDAITLNITTSGEQIEMLYGASKLRLFTNGTTAGLFTLGFDTRFLVDGTPVGNVCTWVAPETRTAGAYFFEAAIAMPTQVYSPSAGAHVIKLQCRKNAAAFASATPDNRLDGGILRVNELRKPGA